MITQIVGEKSHEILREIFQQGISLLLTKLYHTGHAVIVRETSVLQMTGAGVNNYTSATRPALCVFALLALPINYSRIS